MISPPMVDALNSSSEPPSDEPEANPSPRTEDVPLVVSSEEVGRSGDNRRESCGGAASDGGGVLMMESATEGCSSLIDD